MRTTQRRRPVAGPVRHTAQIESVATQSTLREESIARIDRICHELDLRPSDHLLEIGTGWGALAIHAAREYGCRMTTTTISKQQHALAERCVRAAGLQDRITLLLSDYRDLERE